MSVVADLEQFMLSNIAVGMGLESLPPDVDVLEQGILDSLGLMKLIDFIENSYRIRILDEEIVPDNFQSIHRIAALIETRKGHDQARTAEAGPLHHSASPAQ